MHPHPLTPWQSLRRSIRMVAQAAPNELRRLAYLNLLTGIGPSVSLFLGKVVIDEVAAIFETGGVDDPLAVMLGNSRLLWSVAIALGLNLVVDSVDAIGSSLFASLRDRVEGYVRGKVLDKVVNFNDIVLESGTHQELMALGGSYYSMCSRQASSYSEHTSEDYALPTR